MDKLAAYDSDGSDEEGSVRDSQKPKHGKTAEKDAVFPVNASLRPPPPYNPESEGAILSHVSRPIVNRDRLLMHVFLPISGKPVAAFVKRLLGLARLQLVGKSVKASFCEHDSLHISLSRPCAIDVSRVPELLAELGSALSVQQGGMVAVEEFVIALPSQNNSRLFTAAPVSSESAEKVVLPLIRCVDHAFGRLSLPLFYENPLPHMSFASTSTTAIKESFPDPSARPTTPPNCIQLYVGTVTCEIGHRQYSFSLKA